MAQSPKDKDKQPDQPPPRRNRSEAVMHSAGFVGGAALARAGFRDPTLVLRWDEIAGPELARIARPLKWSEGASGGTLTLKAEPGAALFLQHETRALCERINTYLGDAKSVSIAAASIIAKVTRDRFMQKLHYEHPHYGWFNNKGYGTPDHYAGLEKHGPCVHHRRSFGPIHNMLYPQTPVTQDVTL